MDKATAISGAASSIVVAIVVVVIITIFTVVNTYPTEQGSFQLLGSVELSQKPQSLSQYD